MRVAARLAYWGPAYHGYARQPSVDTVEGDLVRALTRIRAIHDLASARLAAASRTDRGVSALANVVAFDTSFPHGKLSQATNGRMHDAWLWTSMPVPEGFNPRRALLRRYRYHLPRDVSMEKVREAAELFQGDHDFASFTVDRLHGRLTIDRIRVRRDPWFVVVDFEAKRFARGLLRRVAGAIEAYARGGVDKTALRDALMGGSLRTSPASPEGLFLLDVDCGLTWPAASERLAKAIRTRLRVAALAHRFATELVEGISRSDARTPSARKRRTY